MPISFSQEISCVTCSEDCPIRSVGESFWANTDKDPFGNAYLFANVLEDIGRGSLKPLDALSVIEVEGDALLGGEPGEYFHIVHDELSGEGELILDCFKKRFNNECDNKSATEITLPAMSALAGANVLETLLTHGNDEARSTIAKNLRDEIAELAAEDSEVMKVYGPILSFTDNELIALAEMFLDAEHQSSVDE